MCNILGYPSPSQTHNRQTRKRRPDRSVETGAERPPKRARLTIENLKAFEKIGGQGKKPARKKSARRSSSTTTTTDEDLGPQRHTPKSKSLYSDTKSTRLKQTTLTTDLAFLDIAFQNRILNLICSKPPVNLKSRQERIDRSRSTALLSKSDYRHFASAIRRVPNKASVLVKTATYLLKRYNDPRYQRSYN
jgi:hypothetical protein